MLIPSLRLRTAAIFAALVFASTGGLAAAGALPDQAEEAVSAILSGLGLSLPDQAGGVDPAADTPAQAEEGLAIAAIAAIASGSEERSVERGALISTIASDGKSQAGEHGAAGAGEAPERGRDANGRRRKRRRERARHEHRRCPKWRRERSRFRKRGRRAGARQCWRRGCRSSSGRRCREQRAGTAQAVSLPNSLSERASSEALSPCKQGRNEGPRFESGRRLFRFVGLLHRSVS
jgi:hypothetical protein